MKWVEYDNPSWSRVTYEFMAVLLVSPEAPSWAWSCKVGWFGKRMEFLICSLSIMNNRSGLMQAQDLKKINWGNYCSWFVVSTCVQKQVVDGVRRVQSTKQGTHCSSMSFMTQKHSLQYIVWTYETKVHWRMPQVVVSKCTQRVNRPKYICSTSKDLSWIIEPDTLVRVSNKYFTLMLPLDQNSIATASSRIASCTTLRKSASPLAQQFKGTQLQ